MTAVSAGATILSSHAQSSAINKATDAQTAAYQQALALQEKQYNQQRQDYAPWRAVGLGALQQLAQTENINLPANFFQGQMDSAVSTANGGGANAGQPANPNPNPAAGALGAITGSQNGSQDPTRTGVVSQFGFGGAPGSQPATGTGAYTPPTPVAGATPAPATQPAATTPPGTTPPATTPAGVTPPNAGAANAGGQFGAFYASPDYQFRVDQGTRAITGNKAAAGLLDSGALGQGLINYGQAAGSQEFGNWYNRIAALAGVGQSATDASTQAGANATNAMTGLINNQGNNLASSYISQGKVNSGLISSLGGQIGGAFGNLGGGMGSMGQAGAGMSNIGASIGGLFGSPI